MQKIKHAGIWRLIVKTKISETSESELNGGVLEAMTLANLSVTCLSCSSCGTVVVNLYSYQSEWASVSIHCETHQVIAEVRRNSVVVSVDGTVCFIKPKTLWTKGTVLGFPPWQVRYTSQNTFTCSRYEVLVSSLSLSFLYSFEHAVAPSFYFAAWTACQ